MRITDRGWIVLWTILLCLMFLFVLAVDRFVMDLTPTQQEMESLR